MIITMNATSCSLCTLIRRLGSFSEPVIGRCSGIPWQIEGNSFGDHLISESVSVMSSSLIEASFYFALFCVVMACVRYNIDQRVFTYDCYVKRKLVQIVQEKILP
jgi:hypothetical protein